jgi:spore maturation protein CgeB
MEDDFENKKHLCWFHTIEEGLELIDYYLKHDEEREKIAWEGWRHACKHFTFRERLRDFEADLRGFFPESFS